MSVSVAHLVDQIVWKAAQRDQDDLGAVLGLDRGRGLVSVCGRRQSCSGLTTGSWSSLTSSALLARTAPRLPRAARRLPHVALERVADGAQGL